MRTNPQLQGRAIIPIWPWHLSHLLLHPHGKADHRSSMLTIKADKIACHHISISDSFDLSLSLSIFGCHIMNPYLKTSATHLVESWELIQDDIIKPRVQVIKGLHHLWIDVGMGKG